MGAYEIEQVCLNGHVVTRYLPSNPHGKQDFCDKCGERTINSCPECTAVIRGAYHSSGPFTVYDDNQPAPLYCRKCGHPYPWTTRSLQAAKEYIEQLGELTPADQEELKSSLDDIIARGPRSKLGEHKFKRIVTKLGKASYMLFKDFVFPLFAPEIFRRLFG